MRLKANLWRRATSHPSDPFYFGISAFPPNLILPSLQKTTMTGLVLELTHRQRNSRGLNGVHLCKTDILTKMRIFLLSCFQDHNHSCKVNFIMIFFSLYSINNNNLKSLTFTFFFLKKTKNVSRLFATRS